MSSLNQAFPLDLHPFPLNQIESCFFSSKSFPFSHFYASSVQTMAGYLENSSLRITGSIFLYTLALLYFDVRHMYSKCTSSHYTWILIDLTQKLNIWMLLSLRQWRPNFNGAWKMPNDYLCVCVCVSVCVCASLAVNAVLNEGWHSIFHEHGLISNTACWMTVIHIQFTQLNVTSIGLGYYMIYPSWGCHKLAYEFKFTM